MWQTPEWKAWSSMRERCNCKTNLNYKRYGGRGITICKRWNKFENFFKDMGKRPHGHSLDRIDNNGNYSPSNCRWATPREQANNTRLARKISFNNGLVSVSELSRLSGVKRTTISRRLAANVSQERLTTVGRLLNADCKNGHPLSGPNLIFAGRKKERRCRICTNKRKMDSYYRKRQMFLPPEKKE